jgi:hypothetical protein
VKRATRVWCGIVVWLAESRWWWFEIDILWSRDQIAWERHVGAVWDVFTDLAGPRLRKFGGGSHADHLGLYYIISHLQESCNIQLNSTAIEVATSYLARTTLHSTSQKRHTP